MYGCDPSVVTGKLYDSDFWHLHNNFEKKLLTLSFLSVCLSAWNNSGFMGQVFMKFDNCFYSF